MRATLADQPARRELELEEVPEEHDFCQMCDERRKAFHPKPCQWKREWNMNPWDIVGAIGLIVIAVIYIVEDSSDK